MEAKKTTWDILSSINCNEHTEKKNGLTYLSWAWAWGITKKNFPSANYRVINFLGYPYLFDAQLGYLVQTEVTIDGETIGMQLPVMDGANKAQKAMPYKYSTKFGEKTVEAATMFDINTAIMRCLTKNLAMFGLGHYIYAGEDIPQTEEAGSEKKTSKMPEPIQTDIGEMRKYVIEKSLANVAIKNNILTNLSLGSLDDLSDEQIKTIYSKLKK